MKRAADDVAPNDTADEQRRTVVLRTANDVGAVRRSVGIRRRAVRGVGAVTIGLHFSKSGFDGLLANVLADAALEAQRGRDAQLRYAAIVGGDVTMVAERDDAHDAANYEQTGGLSCAICFAAPCLRVAVPCGHRFACVTCAALLLATSAQCAVCCQAVERFGSVQDVATVYEAGVDVERSAPLVTVRFTLPRDKNVYDDRVSVARDEDDVRAAIEAYAKARNGDGGDKDDEGGAAPRDVAVAELADRAPSLFWSLYALALRTDGDGAKDMEARMVAAQCRLLGIERAPGRARRATRRRAGR